MSKELKFKKPSKNKKTVSIKGLYAQIKEINSESYDGIKLPKDFNDEMFFGSLTRNNE